MKDFPNHHNRKKIARLRRTRNALTVVAVLLAVSIVAVYFLTAPFGISADSPSMFPVQRIIPARREQAQETTAATEASTEAPVEPEVPASPDHSGHPSGGNTPAPAPVTPKPAPTDAPTVDPSETDPTIEGNDNTESEGDPNSPDSGDDKVPDQGDNNNPDNVDPNVPGSGGKPDNGNTDNPGANGGGNKPDSGNNGDNVGPDNGENKPGGDDTSNGGGSNPNGGDTPNGGGSTPNGGDTPNGGGSNPNGGGSNPNGGGSNPNGGGSNPNGGGSNPNGGGSNPNGGGSNPNGGDSNPNGGDTPNGGGSNPNGGDTPNGGGSNPNGGSTSNGGSTPSGKGTDSSANPGSSGTNSAPSPEVNGDAVDMENTDTLIQGEASSNAQNNFAGAASGSTPPSVFWISVFITLTVLLGIDIIIIIVLDCRIHKLKHMPLPEAQESAPTPAPVAEPLTVKEEMKETPPAPKAPGGVQIANLQHIGARPRQEDSSGVAKLSDGVIAIVADGMGGLAGGDRVSQKIVYTMLECSSKLAPGQMDGVLPNMVKYVTETVNTMIGEENYYKMGSTLLAVLVRNNRFHWITVGDSHIYLFRDGTLIQLNQEHNRGQDLILQAVQGEISFSEARNAPKKGGLTSFIGMGNLRCVDRSLQQIPLKAGDRIMLCTDGVFNTLPDNGIETILRSCPDVQQAADQIQQTILRRNHPKQDNFTAIILGF